MNYNYWKKHFEENRSHFSDIDWQLQDQLSAAETKLIASSLQQFQKGENSEGKHLFAYAKTFPDPLYIECIRLFICEEQMHARVLANFMRRYSIPTIKGHWVDSVFRQLRKLAGIQNTIMILLIAEIISKLYYAALRKATHSELLQKICAQILKDEDYHISFQCFTLRLLFQHKSSLARFLIRTLYFILMSGTIAVVWLYHRNVLSKGGYSFWSFKRAVLNVYYDCETLIFSREIYTADPGILFP
ncbi:MAG: hypothetical protein JSS70_19015 [Bacteroidetes bacterium]|nr:hypothetical protein [Bacteroidota bacterium]